MPGTVSRFTNLQDWLAWQESLHPRPIELGLERVRSVWQRLLPQPTSTPIIISVGGTNGKGSSVAFLEAILLAAGYQVGAYTSPHLLRYNERIRIHGIAVEDAALCQAFAAVDAARLDTSLTYFEFGTLAALHLFHAAQLDVVILEVGLGGRLDAVNILDADAALVTSIALDHTDWLGAVRESIGYEKAGIYRRQRPAICADPQPPTSLLQHAQTIGATLFCAGRDYQFAADGVTWHWQSGAIRVSNLPIPTLAGEHQLANAAAVLMLLTSLQAHLPVPEVAIHAGLVNAKLAGRLQLCTSATGVEWILDVAHNPHAAEALAKYLKLRPKYRRTSAIIGLLADKDAVGIIRALDAVIDAWYTVSLDGARGRAGAQLASLLPAAKVHTATNLAQACHAVQQTAQRIVVLGSFHTVGPVLTMQPWLTTPSSET